MYKDYHDDYDNHSSEEELFRTRSAEAIRTDNDRIRRGRDDSIESLVFRERCDNLPGPRSRTHDRRDDYIQQLHEALDRQEQEIKDLDSKLQDLRGEVRECFSSLEQKLSCFEEKVDFVINLVSSWVNRPPDNRGCRGSCSKHVRTDKCLCRGLKEPHRCCGRIGGVCAC